MSFQDIPLSSHDGSCSELTSVWTCPPRDAPIRDIFVSPQGVVAVVADSSVSLYAGAPSLGAVHTLALGASTLTAYSFSTQGRHFLTGDSNGFVKWWEVPGGEETASMQFPFSKIDGEQLSPITSIVSSSEGDLVAVTSGR